MDVAKGYIGLTDPNWYSFLSAQDQVDEVNFWQPHGERSFRVLITGEPFFFKLRAPQKAIAGFGFFERYESLPAWLAWDCFEKMNGAPDLDSMLDSILSLRHEDGKTVRSGDFKIGCVMLSAPVFFHENEWIDPPSDWAKTGIQQGKTYQLNHGEGYRIYKECLESARKGERYWNVESDSDKVSDERARYGSPVQVIPRMGQGIFRRTVRDAYNGACAVTHEHSEPVLEAAHIIPYNKGGVHQVKNGLFLRRDLHRLYDLGYVTVTPDYKFRVGDCLRDEYKNGRSYYGLNDQTISIPDREILKPNTEFLEWHEKQIFKG